MFVLGAFPLRLRAAVGVHRTFCRWCLAVVCWCSHRQPDVVVVGTIKAHISQSLHLSLSFACCHSISLYQLITGCLGVHIENLSLSSRSQLSAASHSRLVHKKELESIVEQPAHNCDTPLSLSSEAHTVSIRYHIAYTTRRQLSLISRSSPLCNSGL